MKARVAWPVGIALGAVVAASAVRWIGGGRERERPFGAYREALEATEGQAVRDGDTIRGGLERFEAMFSAFDEETIAATARTVYAEDAYFNDLVKELCGGEAIGDYLRHSAGMLATWSLELQDPLVDGIDVYLRWTMTYSTDPDGRAISAPGISQLRFDERGRVILHQDFWDATSGIFERVPVLASVIRAVKGLL